MGIARKIFMVIVIFLGITLNGYESEEKLKVMITGKIAQFIFWKEHYEEQFIITVYKNQYHTLFEDLYADTFIGAKKVKIVYIENIEDLQTTHILYIGNVLNEELETILHAIAKKNIVTISDIRGFAQKGGMIQIYEQNQKLKLRINLEQVKKEHITIKSSLLRICDIIKGDIL